MNFNGRPRLKVDCYKKSGKWAYSNLDDREEYPIIGKELYSCLWDSFGKAPSRGELRDIQSKQTYELSKLIKENNPKVRHLSPEKFGFDNEYIYVIEMLYGDMVNQGFCQFIMDNTEG